jgi:transmembrane sensor
VAAAADWLARRDVGLDPVAQAQFHQWLAADPRHAAAWHELESTWRAFDLPRRSGDAGPMVRELTRRRQRRYRRRVLVGSGTALLLMTAATVMFVARPFGPSPDIALTGSVVVAKPERRHLADGSTVDLNTGAQIEVHFSAAQRDVRLTQGEAHFEVAKDASRPFVVATPLANVRAVGTAFAVGLHRQTLDVLVTEGTVAVGRPTSAAQPPVPVSAGNAAVVPEATASDPTIHVEPIPPTEIERRLAWRSPHLELSNTPLAAVVVAFNRENRLQLSVADPTLARLRFSGVFRADRPADFVRLLEDHYGVHAEHPGPDTIVLHRAP